MGSDPYAAFRFLGEKVSIHAPTWGATDILGESYIAQMFQSTLPHGERLNSGKGLYKLELFQSTLPHGERRSSR